MRDRPEPLGRYVRLQTSQLAPAAFADELFDLYSIPALDETGGAIPTLGAAIESGKFLLSERAVLVSKLNPRKMRVHLLSGKSANRAVASTEFMVYEPRTDVDISIEFLAHLLNGSDFARQLQATATGTTNSHVRAQPAETLNWLLQIPPLAEQRRIAEILDTIDETITVTERTIAKLELALLGLIDQSFRRSQGPLTRLGTACLGPGEYGCSAAAEQPRVGWPRYVRITDVTEAGTLRKDSVMGVPSSVAGKSILYRGDVLFARSGATVGKTYMYDPSDGPCAFAGYLIRFRPDPSKVLPEYVRWWARSSSYWRWINRAMREGAQPNINAREYADALLPLPTIDEQRSIVGAIAGLNDTLSAEKVYGEKLRWTRGGVASDLLSGRVRTVAT